MIEVSDQDFEKLIEKVIKKEITRVELATMLQTDIRTLYGKIYNMQNSELLEKYLEQYPYKPAENKNIDYRNLIIEIIKNNKKISDVLEEYKIAERTYRRNINKIKSQDPRLYSIYKSYIRENIQEDDFKYINSISFGKVCYTKDSTEERKAELLAIFAMYNALKKKGMPEDEILSEIGETRKSLTRKSDELDRMKKSDFFRERIKVGKTPRSSKNKEDSGRNEVIEEKSSKSR